MDPANALYIQNRRVWPFNLDMGMTEKRGQQRFTYLNSRLTFWFVKWNSIGPRPRNRDIKLKMTAQVLDIDPQIQIQSVDNQFRWVFQKHAHVSKQRIIRLDTSGSDNCCPLNVTRKACYGKWHRDAGTRPGGQLWKWPSSTLELVGMR